MTIHLSCVIGLVVLAPLSFRAAQEQLPHFRTGINVIQIDATVLDHDGKPVRGLTEADFTVLENDRPQRVIGVSEIVLPDPVTPTAAWQRDVAHDVADNQAPEGRLLVLVMDDAMVPPDAGIIRTSKEIARAAVERMGPADRMAVVFTRDNRYAQDFTADRGRLLNAIDRMSIGFMFSGGPQSRHFYEASLATLRLVAEALRKVPYRRKAIIYVSVGVPIDFDRIGMSLPSAIDVATADGLLDRVRDVLGQAVWSNTAIYAFDPSGVGGLEAFAASRPKVQIRDPRRFRWFLEGVAENSGGRATLLTNDFGNGLTRMFEDTSSYYLLGYESASHQDDGKFRRVEIKTNRPGTSVRTRSGYFGRLRQQNPNRENPSSAALAIANVIPRADLPMQATAAPFAATAKNAATVAIVVQLGHEIPEAVSRHRIDLAVGVFDHDGRERLSQRQTVSVQFRQGTQREAIYELLTSVDVKPGRYIIRIGAHNGAINKNGSVFVDVDVPDFSRDQLSLSGLLMTTSSSPMVAPRDALQHIVPIVPSTLRHFNRADRVSGFLRVYQGSKELLQTVLVSVRLTDAGNRVVSNRTESIPGDWFKGTRAFDFALPMDLTTLSSGEYLLEVEAQASTLKPQRRHVRFRIS